MVTGEKGGFAVVGGNVNELSINQNVAHMDHLRSRSGPEFCYMTAGVMMPMTAQSNTMMTPAQFAMSADTMVSLATSMSESYSD
jgi:hypothetical protein